MTDLRVEGVLVEGRVYEPGEGPVRTRRFRGGNFGQEDIYIPPPPLFPLSRMLWYWSWRFRRWCLKVREAACTSATTSA